MGAILQFLFRYARRYIPQYALGGVMLFATNYAAVRIPTLIGGALNVIESAGPEALRGSRMLAIELMVWGLVLVGVRTLSRVLFFNPGRDVQFAVMNDIFGHLLTLQRPFYMKRKVGELVSVVSNDTQSVRLLVGFAGLQLFNVAVAIPMHLWQMVRTDWILTLWCIGPVILGGIYMRWTVMRFYTLVRRSLERLASLSDRILESYSGVGTVRSHAAEDAALARFQERNREYLDLQLEVARIRAFSMPALMFAGLVSAGIVLWVGGQRVLIGAIQIGDLATFTALLISLVAVLMSLAWVLAAISRGSVAVQRVREVLETERDVPDGTERLDLDAPPSLEIRDLSFRYRGADEDALHEVSATIAPGKTLGIFGHTGSGKTTLIEILSRIYDPAPGTVFIDGRDIASVRLADLRREMAVVPQAPFLFSTTLRENVRLAGGQTGHALTDDARHRRPHVGSRRRPAPGEPDAEREVPPTKTDPRLDRVLDAACLRPDVASLAEGLETVVGERGVMLSGGQRQRAALARALYRSPKLLLLDDVLSAVDQATETKLVEAIRGLSDSNEPGMQAPTTIIVSHRTSVLEHADEILVLDHGRVVERGNHQALLAEGGRYAEANVHQREEHP